MSSRYSAGGQKELPRIGQHLARCYQVIDFGTQIEEIGGETKARRKVRLAFELPNCLLQGTYKAELKGKPFSVARNFTQSLHTKAALRLALEAWRGKPFTEQQVSEFSDKDLLGKTCVVTLALSRNGSNANIVAFAPPKDLEGKALVCPPAVNPPVYLSLEPNEFDGDTFGKLPDWMKEEIDKSPEYKRLFAESREGEQPSDDEAAAATAPADDIPF